MRFYKVLLIVISILSSGYIIHLVKKSKLHIMQLFWWLIVILSVLVFGLFPSVVDFIGHILGVSYPPIIVLVVAYLFILIEMIQMDKYITENEILIKELVQKVAILEAEIENKDCGNDKKQS